MQSICAKIDPCESKFHLETAISVLARQSDSDKSDRITLQGKTRQSSGRVGARIDVDTVRPNVRLQNGSVPVHDNFAKMVLA
jgi:hypothetical protein